MSASRPRAWITGLGLVSPIGQTVGEFWNAALEGRSGTRQLDFDWLEGRSFRTKIGAPVTGFDFGRWGYTERDARTLDPVSQFALAATRQALEDAQFTVTRLEGKSASFSVGGCDADRVGVVVGTGMGGLKAFEASHEYYLRVGGPEGASWARYGLPMCIVNAPAANVGIRHGFHGENKAIGTACATGTMAIGDAARLVWSGAADVAIAGGCDAALSDHDGLGLMGFDVLRCMSTEWNDAEHASRPFDRRRDGFVLGEGAGVVVIESEAHARARGARPYAEIAAYDSVSDGYSMLQPEPHGLQMRRMLERVLRMADVSPRDVDLVSAHGTATEAGDKVEASALRDLLGSSVQDARVTAIKSMTGHAISASGVLETIACALAMREGVVPPTANLDDVDDGCELNHVVGAAWRGSVDVALKPSYGFGGHAAALVLRKA
jgi:3-oxoacyl-[acyl-carrier-protein] synthase II